MGRLSTQQEQDVAKLVQKRLSNSWSNTGHMTKGNLLSAVQSFDTKVTTAENEVITTLATLTEVDSADAQPIVKEIAIARLEVLTDG